MASIGEQIREARKAKGMTQDDLAAIMNVSRSSVANWEIGRRVPDGETLLRLTAALEHRFDEAIAPDSDLPVNHVNIEEQNLQSGGVKPTRRRVWIAAGVALLVCAVLLGRLVLPTARSPETSARERAYKSPADGETYTIARFEQEAVSETGKAYLRATTSLKVNRGENYDYWLFEISYHEMNGVALSIDRVEQVIFAKEKENVEQMITAADLRAYGMETEVPAHGDWVFSGGLPVQDTVLGVGVLLRGTDENGAELAFTSYIPLADQ